MALSYTTTTHATDPSWREIPAAGREWVRGGLLAGSNGTTVFGDVLAGQLLALNPAGTYRPLGAQSLASAVAGANLLEVDDSSGFFVADVVDLRAGVDAEAQVEIDASGAGDTLRVTAQEPGQWENCIDIVLADPGVINSPLSISAAWVDPDLTITVSLATDGAGAITSTVTEVAAIINATYAELLYADVSAGVGAIVCIAVAAADMAGGQLQGDILAATRTVTLIDRTTTPHQITVSGAALTLRDGDVVHNADECAGVLEHSVSTARLVNGALSSADQPCKVALEAATTAAKLGGYDACLEQYLHGGPASGALGSTDGWPIKGLLLL